MRIVIMGAGGVGGYFGAKLARAGQAVTMVGRGAHLEAIRRHGLRIRSTVEGDSVARVEATEDLAGAPPADLVLLCVKAFDTEAALARVQPAVGADTAVLSLQNGVGSAEAIEAALGRGHALGGVAYVFATIEAPGVIAHRFAGRIVFGELDGRVTARAEAIKAALDGAGIPNDLSTEIQRVLWEKYLMIGAQAGMTALTRCRLGVVRSTPETWRMYRMLVEEFAAVGQAEGVKLGADVVERIVKMAEGVSGDTYSSLHHDLVSGKRLELDALHGHVVRLGERLGVATPASFAVYAALKPHVDGRRD